MIETRETMPEQTDYFDKFLEAKFAHIDASITSISDSMKDLKEQFSNQFTDLRKEVKEENRTTRKWMVTTAISLMVGFTAIAIAIFFGFSKLQTSWIQTVISFVGKTVVK